MSRMNLKSIMLLLLLTITANAYSQKVYYYSTLGKTHTQDNRIQYTEPQNNKPLNGKCKIVDNSYSGDSFYLLTMKKGFRDGKDSYYKRGRLETECYYQNGLRHGQLKKYTSDGKVVRSVNFKNGKIDGTDIYYFTDGSIEREANYKDGVLHGRDVTYSSETKQPTSDKFFENGKPMGKQTEHIWDNVSGDYIRISNYVEGGMDACTEYYTNGKIKEENTLQPGSIRITKSYYSSGVIASEELYKENKKNGEQKSYDKDGKLERLTTYLNGQKTGSEKEYYPDGTLKSERGYVDDYREGIFIEYYPNATKKSEWMYVRNRCTGPFKIYYDNGMVQEEGTVTNGDYETRKIYYKNGQLKSYQTLNDGELTEIEKYDESGKQL